MAFANLTTEQLESEANLAADLVRDAASRQDAEAEAQADDLFMQLLAEISRREQLQWL
jgi:hypothetical protein